MRLGQETRISTALKATLSIRPLSSGQREITEGFHTGDCPDYLTPNTSRGGVLTITAHLGAGNPVRIMAIKSTPEKGGSFKKQSDWIISKCENQGVPLAPDPAVPGFLLLG